MPSLSELGKFRASFNDIGGQRADLLARQIPFDELELPTTEPETPSAAPEPVPESTGSDDIDFSAFLGTQAHDLPDMPAADITDIQEQQEDVHNAEDLYAPQELLSNLSEELDAIPPDFPDESPRTDSALDLDSLDNFDLPEEPLPAGRSKELSLEDDPFHADSADDFSLDSFDDFNLPDEPLSADIGESPDIDTAIDFDTPIESPEEPVVTHEDESTGESFSDMFDGFNEPAETYNDTAASEESNEIALPDETDADENFDLNLDNFNDFDLTSETPDEALTTEDESLDLDNLGDFSLSTETPDESGKSTTADEDESGNFDLGNFDDFALPQDTSSTDTDESGNIDLGSFDDFAPPSESNETDIDESGGIDLGSFDDFDLPQDTSSTDESGGIDLGSFDDFDLPADTSSTDESADFESFDVPAAHEETPDSSAMDDFSFPELDNVLKKTHEKTSASPAAKPVKKEKRFGKGKPVKSSAETSPDDVEEIHLSDEEFAGLQETLSRYPLNLRIACEEAIAEQAINPKQMSELIEHLVWGASAKETAILVGHILGRTITIPKAFEKSSGAELEAEQASFAYIFVHNFLPLLRIFMFIAVAAGSLFYLIYKFAYIPHKAETLYKMGYERIYDGEYQRANERFSEAFGIHRKKNWFYKYAEAFRDERQYIYAEQKYDELLRYYIRDKKGILDYSVLETYYLRNYAKADTILRNQLLDYAPNDYEGLIAAGDNCLIWGDVDKSKYEDARYYYARMLDKFGWKDPIVERMMKYFIRTDNLKEVLPLKNWFESNPRRSLSAESLAELGGYLLDKKLEEVRGVPNEYVEAIDGVRDLLLKAVYADQSLPEPHYHLARYYKSLGNTHEERVTLRIAVEKFEKAPEGSIRRLGYHIDALQRYADVLINAREFIPAEEQLKKGIDLYEDALSRRLMVSSPQYGRLYSGLGDLEYFTKVGDMEAALRYYRRAEQNNWAPPEMLYRMGSAYYQLENWKSALEYLFNASSSLPLNRRVLFALGNTALKRGDYFAAQGYYNRLLDILETQRARLPVLLPNDRPEYLELAERLMMARNNAGVASEMLAGQTGSRSYLTRAQALYAEAQRAWDARTRDPRTMIRSGSTPLPYLNSRNILYPQGNYEPQIFIRIDREAMENSPWEELAPSF